MAITVGRIVTRAQKTLLDETGVQWGEDELIDYVNAAMNAIVGYKPDAYIKDQAFSIANSSKQTLPADGIVLIDITQNLGAGGATPGKAIRQIDRTHLDHTNPDWHTATGTAVLHFTYDKRNPKTFYIYPYVAGTWNVRIAYSAHPPAVDDTADAFPMDDLYENPAYFWIMAAAYAKNSKREDIGKYQLYSKQFSDCLGLKQQAQIQYTPVPPDESLTSTGQGER